MPQSSFARLADNVADRALAVDAVHGNLARVVVHDTQKLAGAVDARMDGQDGRDCGFP
jgi:hypothetical protein